MKAPAEKSFEEKKKIHDKGIEEGAAQLTQEKVHQVVQQMLSAEGAPALKPISKPVPIAGCAAKPAITISPTITTRSIRRRVKSNRPSVKLLKKRARYRSILLKRLAKSASPNATSAAAASCTAPLASMWPI